jgi:hypothetical protein
MRLPVAYAIGICVITFIALAIGTILSVVYIFFGIHPAFSEGADKNEVRRLLPFGAGAVSCSASARSGASGGCRAE